MALPDLSEALRADLTAGQVTDADIQAIDPAHSTPTVTPPSVEGTSKETPPTQGASSPGSAAAPGTQPGVASDPSASAGASAIPTSPSSPAKATPAAPTEAFVSIREAAKNLGLDLSGYSDDESALRALVAQAGQTQQLSQLAQYGQTYLQHAREFEQFRAEQAAKQAAQPKPAESFWKAPEYDPRWEHMITKDEQGNLKTIPGAPPEILPKFHAYADWLRQRQTEFYRDPIQTLKPGIEGLIDQRAKELVKSELDAMREQQHAERFLADNQSWLLQHDGQNNVLHTPQTGQPMLSEAGKQFYAHLRRAGDIGVKGHQEQANYARQMVYLDQLSKQVQNNANPAAANQAVKDNLIRQQAAASNQPNHAASTAPATNGRGGVQNSQLTLAEMLRADMKSEGVTDQMIAETIGEAR